MVSNSSRTSIDMSFFALKVFECAMTAVLGSTFSSDGLRRLSYVILCLHRWVWMYLNPNSFLVYFILVLAGSSVHLAIQLRNQNLLSTLNIMLQPHILLHQSRKEAAPYLNCQVTNLKPLSSSVMSKAPWFHNTRCDLSNICPFFVLLRLNKQSCC